MSDFCPPIIRRSLALLMICAIGLVLAAGPAFATSYETDLSCNSMMSMPCCMDGSMDEADESRLPCEPNRMCPAGMCISVTHYTTVMTENGSQSGLPVFSLTEFHPVSTHYSPYSLSVPQQPPRI